MALRRIPGTDREYHLIAYDRRGDELPDADGAAASDAAIAALTDPSAAITDVFILCHGWQGDYQDAISQYDAWLGALDPDREGDGIRPFAIGLHWPSKAWSDRALRGEPDGLLGADDAEGAQDALTADEAVEYYAAVLDAGPELHEALRTVLAAAADADPAAQTRPGERLPPDVADAYRQIAAAVDTDAEDPLLGDTWDPEVAFEDTVSAAPPEDEGLLGIGDWLRSLREAILTPLRQLTFWHSKNHAREFGEGAAAALLRRIMDVSAARVHLAGHSFGTIVLSSAVRGAGDHPVPPPRPVDSLLLVQGALSLWAFAERAPEEFGGGRGRLTEVTGAEFTAGPIVATRSKWDYAVGRFYPLAVGLAGEYLLGDDLPKFGGIGTWGIQGVSGAVELPPLEHGHRSWPELADGRVHNIDASAVIARLSGAAGAHSDIAHPELVWLAWRAAQAGPPTS